MAKSGVLRADTRVEWAGERPYPPSWVDNLTLRLGALPGPSWLAYFVGALVPALLEVGVKWLDGSYAASADHLFFHFGFGAYPFIVLWLVRYLDARAGRALAIYRPVGEIDDATFARLRYQLTTMPAAPMVAIALLVVPVSVLILLLSGTGWASEVQLFGSPYSGVVDLVIGLAVLVMGYVLIYHTVRQLVLIERIQRAHSGISIFDLQPAHAFSAVTARSAVGVILLNYFFVVTEGGPAAIGRLDLQGIDSAANLAGSVLLGAATFLLPMLGMHGVLRQLKKDKLRAVDRMIQTTTDSLNHQLEAGDLEWVGKLKIALDGLVVQRDLLKKVSPWPWQLETINGVAVAILLPVILWIVERLMGRLF